jgi:hypothetical protein
MILPVDFARFMENITCSGLQTGELSLRSTLRQPKDGWRVK